MSTIVQTIPDGVPIDGTPGRGGVELGEAPIRLAAVYVAAPSLDVATIRATLAAAKGVELVELAAVSAVEGPPDSIAYVPPGGVPLPGASGLSIVVASHVGTATLWIVLE